MKNSKSAACTMYHNPRCSKSRMTLALLQERGIDPVIIDYLNAPLSVTQLQAVLAKLNLQPSELLRKGEEVYKTKIAGKHLTNEQLLAAMVENPILIERPIVVWGERAALGRPPENVLTLLD